VFEVKLLLDRENIRHSLI